MSLSVVNNSLSVSDVNLLSSSSVVSLDRIDPVTKTADFTVSGGYDVYIVAGASANVNVTLPSAALNNGRVLHFKNQSGTYTLASANADVCARNSSTPAVANTAFLAAVNGNSTTLVSNGVYWFSIKHANF
jgi:hypothetical protein